MFPRSRPYFTSCQFFAQPTSTFSGTFRLIAAVISLVLWVIEREAALPYEALAILAVVLLNAIMGYLQESRAESAVNAPSRAAATTRLI